jgi:hypothetical protein
LLRLGAESSIVSVRLHVEVGNEVVVERLTCLRWLHHKVLAGVLKLGGTSLKRGLVGSCALLGLRGVSAFKELLVGWFLDIADWSGR